MLLVETGCGIRYAIEWPDIDSLEDFIKSYLVFLHELEKWIMVIQTLKLI